MCELFIRINKGINYQRVLNLLPINVKFKIRSIRTQNIKIMRDTFTSCRCNDLEALRVQKSINIKIVLYKSYI